jgi:hypothetical protein
MPMLYGKDRSRAELSEYAGSISQLAGIRPFRFIRGRADGLQAADVRTGSGFSFTVLMDRGLDIAHAEYCGRPIGWISKNGVVAPAFHEVPGFGWLRTFTGGLLTTCGLTQVGSPGLEGEEVLGLHGRISHLPAESFHFTEGWEGDQYVLRVAGQVRESCIYAENLLLKREIVCRLGESSITINDVVENQGYNETPFMILYHINFGYPVVSEHSRLYSSAAGATPWNEDAKRGNGIHDRFDRPTAGYRFQVFALNMPANRDRAYAAIVNESLDFGAYVAYSPQELPCFSEWKMMGQQDYVVGLEPGTNGSEGRIEARKTGRLATLRPGESRRFRYEIGVLGDRRDIESLAGKL